MMTASFGLMQETLPTGIYQHKAFVVDAITKSSLNIL